MERHDAISHQPSPIS